MRNLIILLLFTTSIFGQNNSLVSDEELCIQIKSSIKYLKKDKNLKVRSIRIDSILRDGWSYITLAPDYVAYKLDIPKEKIYEDRTEEGNQIWKMMENKSFNSGKSLSLSCINTNRNKPNAILSKLDKESLLIQITSKRVGKQGSSGRTYIFFFKNREIDKVVSEAWIE
jgi:hypothetical protein